MSVPEMSLSRDEFVWQGRGAQSQSMGGFSQSPIQGSIPYSRSWVEVRISPKLAIVFPDTDALSEMIAFHR